jgi:hypothetical protein
MESDPCHDLHWKRPFRIHLLCHLKCGHSRVWLVHTPVILATQEAEIRRIKVQSQPRANSSRDPISKISNTKKDCRVAQVVEQV